MTANRAFKTDVRLRQHATGESFSDAARYVAQLNGLPRVAFAYARSVGRLVLHGVVDAGTTRSSIDAGQYIVHARSLCGKTARDSMGGGGWAIDRSWEPGADRKAAVPFDPDFIDPRSSSVHPCGDCVRVFRESFQPDSKETKVCAVCRESRPVNKFRSNNACADGLARTCEDCRRAARRQAEADARDAEIAARRSKRHDMQGAWVQAIADWQSSALVRPFVCDAGHVLEGCAVGDELVWRCQCGTQPIAKVVLNLVRALNGALPELAGTPTVVSMP